MQTTTPMPDLLTSDRACLLMTPFRRVSAWGWAVCRDESDDSSELSVYQPRLQLPDIWKQPPQRPVQKKGESSKLPVLREGRSNSPAPPGV